MLHDLPWQRLGPSWGDTICFRSADGGGELACYQGTRPARFWTCEPTDVSMSGTARFTNAR